MDPEIERLLAKKAKRKAVAGGKVIPLTVIRNYLHQSFFYLDKTERRVRVAWEILPVLAALGFLPSGASRACYLMTAGVALLIVHTLNWVFNNNFWNCINCAFPAMRNRGTEGTILYLNSVKKRLERHACITGIMLLGSLCRMEWHARSDIDMRILRAPGFLQGLLAALLVSRERVLAVFARQPLDVYLADAPSFLDRRRKDETPIFLIKRDPRLLPDKYPMAAITELQPQMFREGKRKTD